jgi:hypothetical protein
MMQNVGGGIKSRIAMARAAFNNLALFTSKLDLNLKKKLVRWEDEEEDISSYWMTLRKREDTGN